MNVRTDALLETHRGWAQWAFHRLRLKHLHIEAALYESGYQFRIFLKQSSLPFSELADEFDHGIRPATSDIRLTNELPEGFTLLPSNHGLEHEFWLGGEPMPAGWLNEILSLVSPNLPIGALDFLHDKHQYVFRHFGINESEKSRVVSACQSIGITTPIAFTLESPALNAPQKTVETRDALEVSSLRRLRPNNPVTRSLLERDEDEWRSFISNRQSLQFNTPATFQPKRFACLFDLRDSGPVKLSELMTIYDVVNVIPDSNTDWLVKHHLDLAGFEELISLGRLRLVLPDAIEKYPEQIVMAAANIDPASITLTRSLAAMTIKNGQKKDPLLYGPFTLQDRLEILSAIFRFTADETLRKMLTTYGDLIEQQHRAFAFRGANATLGVGLGMHLGNILKLIRGVDARLELSTVGASIEWAMGLGAAYIPRQLDGFDETNNASLFASFVSRTKAAPKEPLSDRMHTVINGLLGVTNIPPVEVARNFSPQSLLQFRRLANGLISGTSSTEDLSKIVDTLNEDVRAFERRRNRLVRFKVDTALLAVAAKPVLDLADDKLGTWTSVFASYFSAMLMQELLRRSSGQAIRDISQGLMDTILGLAISPSNDAVITWRARQDLAD